MLGSIHDSMTNISSYSKHLYVYVVAVRQSQCFHSQATARQLILSSILLSIRELNYFVISHFRIPNDSPRHKRWPAGQYSLSFTGPYGPPRYMSDHQISNSAGPNDDKTQYVVLAFGAGTRPTSRQFSGSPFATARR